MNKSIFAKSLLALSVTAALAFTAPMVVGQDKGAPKAAAAKDSKGPNANKGQRRASSQATQDVDTLQMAQRLARYGDQNKDALALITSVQIQKRLGVRQLQEDPKDAARNKGADSKPARDDSVNGLLERARQYAAGRQDLVAMIDDAAKTGTRGSGNPGCFDTKVVSTNGRYFYSENMRGGEAAIVTLRGDGDSDLDLIIRDAYNNVVCVADGNSDNERCTWYPNQGGRFNIEVRNLGVANLHKVCTN